MSVDLRRAASARRPPARMRADASSRSNRMPPGLEKICAIARDRGAAHVFIVVGRQRADEAQPLDAVVVLVAIEVLADEDARVPAQRRATPSGTRAPAAAPAKNTIWPTSPPAAADLAHVVAAERHQQQIGADAHERRRVEHRPGARRRRPATTADCAARRSRSAAPRTH